MQPPSSPSSSLHRLLKGKAYLLRSSRTRLQDSLGSLKKARDSSSSLISTSKDKMAQKQQLSPRPARKLTFKERKLQKVVQDVRSVQKFEETEAKANQQRRLEEILTQPSKECKTEGDGLQMAILKKKQNFYRIYQQINQHPPRPLSPQESLLGQIQDIKKGARQKGSRKGEKQLMARLCTTNQLLLDSADLALSLKKDIQEQQARIKKTLKGL